MVEKFVVACYGLILHDNKLLMVRQSHGHWAGKWILPGGKLEAGESLEQCVEREVFEETGCKVRAAGQLVAISPYSPESQFEKQVVLVFYRCQYVDGEPARGHNVSAAGWMDDERFGNILLNESVPPEVSSLVSTVCVDSTRFPEVNFDFTRFEDHDR